MAQRKPPPKKPKPRDRRSGRFQTLLTEPLLKRLLMTHRTGADFRNMTALRCGVHPKRLSIWLRQGAELEDESLLARLFLGFALIEGELRAKSIKEVRNPEVKRETTEFEDGKPVSKTSTARATDGIRWYLERRFRQWRADWVEREDEGPVDALLQPQAGGLNVEAAKYIIAQLAERMPPELLAIFTAKGWKPPSLPENAHAEAQERP
jgi:hypothetical protein